MERRAGWSIRKLVKAAGRYHAIQIQAGPHTVTAADPLLDDLRDAIDGHTSANSWHNSGNPTRRPLPGVERQRHTQRRITDQDDTASADRSASAAVKTSIASSGAGP